MHGSECRVRRYQHDERPSRRRKATAYLVRPVPRVATLRLFANLAAKVDANASRPLALRFLIYFCSVTAEPRT